VGDVNDDRILDLSQEDVQVSGPARHPAWRLHTSDDHRTMTQLLRMDQLMAAAVDGGLLVAGPQTAMDELLRGLGDFGVAVRTLQEVRTDLAHC
jgi:hypothetical protein